MTKKVSTSLKRRNISWSHELWWSLVQDVLLSSTWPSLISAPLFQQIFQQSQESTWGTNTVVCPFQAQLPESLSWRDERWKQPHAPMPWSPTNARRSWCRVWELKSVPSGASRLPVWETKLSALWWTAQENWVSIEENPFVSFCKLGWASLWAVLSHNYKPLQCCRKTNLSNLHLWQRSRKDGRKHLNWLQFHPVQGPPWNWCH